MNRKINHLFHCLISIEISIALATWLVELIVLGTEHWRAFLFWMFTENSTDEITRHKALFVAQFMSSYRKDSCKSQPIVNLVIKQIK